MFKKILAQMLGAFLVLGILVACGTQVSQNDPTGHWHGVGKNTGVQNVTADISGNHISISFKYQGQEYLFWSGTYKSSDVKKVLNGMTIEAYTDHKADDSPFGDIQHQEDVTFGNNTLYVPVTFDNDNVMVTMAR